MKKFIAGFLSCAIIMSSTTVFAESVTKNIDAVFGQVKLIVNGTPVDKETLLYDGTTYVPLRAAAEALDMEVGWDGNTSTASLTSKTTASEEEIIFYENHPTVPDFGAIFEIDYFYYEEPENDQSIFAYDAEELPEDAQEIYMDILEEMGFIYDSESDSFSDDESVVGIDYDEEDNFITIAIINY